VGSFAACLATVGHRRQFIADDVIAQVDALIADENRRPCDQLLHFVLALAAEGAVQGFFGRRAFFLGHVGSASLLGF
jgi:hypothetical protein